MSVVIRVENLGKKYRIQHQQRERYTALRDVIANRAKSLFRSQSLAPNSQSPSEEDFWALKDVSFEIEQGEVVGIIGRNGAGKSTLLKILSRITEPTTGRVSIKGRIASLLEVGTGFHPELTGRENIYLNGAILGMSRLEVARKFDEIVAFAEIEKFLDTPVKRYSSGMYMRLAFAVAAHLEPEILVVDEVLAVGDAEFQKKCLGKMSDVARGGRTILFVSHNLQAMQTLCERGVVLNEGQVVFNGGISKAIQVYSERTQVERSWVKANTKADLITPMYFESIEVTLLEDQSNYVLSCEIEISCLESCADAFIAIDICNAMQASVMQALPSPTPFICGQPGRHNVSLSVFLPPMIPLTYFLNFWIGSHNTLTYDYVENAASVNIITPPTKGRVFPYTADHGYIVPKSSYSYSAS
ncbi:MAG: ABC transporter ATP-binding protein [Acidobacteria bacterium]|nr:ABC transporter ATP-binding protein [Acidobacteriota bacterium]MBI3425594.1 ABC transporter ATP-binding protein [Acidobacteriota bacterium]